jgi:ADP-ribosylglycohydrolase
MIPTRAVGSLLGLACGDALGATVEFMTSAAIARAFPDGLRTIVGGGPCHVAPGQVTDDTELALCLARSLAAGRNGFDDDDVADRYAEWAASHPIDMGTTTRNAFVIARGEDIANRMRIRASAVNYASKANGSLMRCAPIGLYGAGFGLDSFDVADMAVEDSTLSHPNAVTREACVALTLAIRLLVGGRFAEEMDEAMQVYDIVHRFMGYRSRLVAVAIGKVPPPIVDKEKIGYVLHALRLAFYELLHAESFAAGVEDAVARGGDTDTNGAITGALLGARFGSTAIPMQWADIVIGVGEASRRPAIYRCDDISALAQTLVRA